MRKYSRDMKEKKMPMTWIWVLAIIILLLIILIPVVKNMLNKKQENKIQEEITTESDEDMTVTVRPESLESKNKKLNENNLEEYGFNKDKTVLVSLDDSEGSTEYVYSLKNIKKVKLIALEVDENGNLKEGDIIQEIDTVGKEKLVLNVLVPENAPNVKVVAEGNSGKKIEMSVSSLSSVAREDNIIEVGKLEAK